MKYQIIEREFKQVSDENLTYEEATIIAGRYNDISDGYTSYDVVEMKPTLKDIRKVKLENIINKINE
jgi:hypothetical protein